MTSPILRLTKKAPASGNPRYCNQCEIWTKQNPGGAEIELSLLFADVRGSTRLAEELGAAEFARLMQRFYQAANAVLIESDAWMDKPVGDEIIASYTPVFAGNHAARAIEGAGDLLQALGYGTSEGPWIEVGGGVHTGLAYIGTVGVEGSGNYDITVLGDAVNVTARLASLAGSGEMLVTEATARSAGLDLTDLPLRQLEIEGRGAPIGAHVMTGASVPVE
ncbi:MAG: adenylate/guanylate cyclase domain-containing protein [Acidimicrobiia bacterium]